jgi:hypothetical protein
MASKPFPREEHRVFKLRQVAGDEVATSGVAVDHVACKLTPCHLAVMGMSMVAIFFS